MNFAVEIVDSADKVSHTADVLEKSAVLIRVVSMSYAFRQNDWLRLKPLMNAVGDLRGMVLNAKARSVFDFAIKGKNWMSNISKTAASIQGLHSVYHESVAIAQSNDSGTTKAAKLSTQVTSAATRAITGILIVPEVLQVCQVLEWTSRQAAQHFPNQQEGFGNIAQFAHDYSTNVVTTFQTFTDGNNIYNYIQTMVNTD